MHWLTPEPVSRLFWVSELDLGIGRADINDPFLKLNPGVL